MFRVVYSGVLTIFGILGILSGVYEMVSEKRPFGREIVPRNAPHATDSWTPNKWRRNGIKLALLGVFLAVVGVAVLIV